MLGGATPDEAQLLRLAPALGMHRTDLLAIAWADVPEDLAPLEPRDAFAIANLAGHAARLSPEQVGELRDRVKLMPREEPAQPARPHRPVEWPRRSPGGMLVRLFANRNMGRRAAHAIMAVTGRVVSPSTLWMAGYGSKKLSGEELADYISVLDVSPADLSDLFVVTGVDLPSVAPGILLEQLRRPD